MTRILSTLDATANRGLTTINDERSLTRTVFRFTVALFQLVDAGRSILLLSR